MRFLIIFMLWLNVSFPTKLNLFSLIFTLSFLTWVLFIISLVHIPISRTVVLRGGNVMSLKLVLLFSLKVQFHLDIITLCLKSMSFLLIDCLPQFHVMLVLTIC